MLSRIGVFIDSLTKTKKNLLLGGFLIGALALTVVVAQQQTSYKQRASEIVSPPTTTGNITLAAQATKTTLIPGEQTDLDVYLLAGDQNVTGLSFSLAPVGNLGIGSSAPAIVSMLNVILPTPPVFNNTLRNSAAFSFHYAGVDTVGNVASGKVKIATIKIAALQRGKTELLFQNVQATALGQIGLLNNQQNVNIQFTVGSQTTPTVSVPTATPTPGIIGSCRTLYDKILAAYDAVNACGTKYNSAADLNKDKFINNQDYLLFLQNTNSGTNQVACTNYLNNTTNPCAIPTPTGNVGIGTSFPRTTITIAPPTATPSGPVAGDATGDKLVDIRDYNRWKDEYLGTLTTKTADFNKDGRVDLIDFSIFRNAFNPTTTTIAPSTPTPIATAKRVFVTSNVYNGDLKSAGSKYGLGIAVDGLDGADKICQGSANTAKLGGTWKAWISDSTSTGNPANRFVRNNMPYKLINGTTIANNWSDLIDGSLQAPINITEYNQNKASGVWSNTQYNGTLMNYASTACGNWLTSSSSAYGNLGSSASASAFWTWNSSNFCSSTNPLFCFEQ